MKNNITYRIYMGSCQVLSIEVPVTFSHEQVIEDLKSNNKNRIGNYWSELICNNVHTRFSIKNGEVCVKTFEL
jgi:hypothetical protein